MQCCASPVGSSPIPHAAVLESIDRQRGWTIGVFGSELLIDVDSMSRRFAGVQIAALEMVGMREHCIGLGRVPHVFLDAEVVHPGVEVERRAPTNWWQVGGAG